MNELTMIEVNDYSIQDAILIGQKFDIEFEKRLIENQIDLIQKYNPFTHLHHRNVNDYDQFLQAVMNKRSEKHPNNVKHLLGGTHYESNNSSCERDISFSGEISF